MRSIAECVCDGIRDIAELREALQLAMQLEFSTIPPYLCAQWSIRDDPDRIEGVLHHVVSQEMNHLALAGNLLAAIGGAPRLAYPGFVPDYPVSTLPGGVQQEMPVDLRPLSFHQIQVFMQIEQPEFAPVALAAPSNPASIGKFYETIIAAFEEIRPPIYADRHAVPVMFYRPVRSVEDAVAVMTRIMAEGEGVPDSPEQPTAEGPEHAHYYLFKEIYRQRRLVLSDGRWSFAGKQLAFPEVHEFSRQDVAGAEVLAFRATFTSLLKELEACWAHGNALNVATMFQIRTLGKRLVANGIQPEFSWLEA